MWNFDELKRMVRGGMMLDDGVFAWLRDDEDGMARAVRFLIVLGLLVGLLPAAVGLVQNIDKTPADEVREALAGIEQVFERIEESGAFGADAEAGEEVLEGIRAGFGIAEKVTGTISETTPAPYPVVRFFEALAAWLSGVFGWLSLWLTWGVLTLLFARMLGGTATVQGMLATTSLVAAPHVLGAFSFVPYGGPLLQVLAFVWGVIVYVKATAVASRFDAARATVAVFAPLLILAVFGCCFVSSIVLLAMGGN